MEQHVKTVNKMIRVATKEFNDYHKKQFKKQFVGIYNENKKGSYGGLTVKKGRYVPYITIAKRSMHTAESMQKHFDACKKVKNRDYCKQNWLGHYATGYFGKWMFVEYAAFHKSRTIGGFYSDNYEHHLNATLAHEVAHAVQHYCRHHAYHVFGKEYKSHGLVWKEVYSRLRENFINPFVQPIVTNDLNQLVEDYKKIYAGMQKTN